MIESLMTKIFKLYFPSIQMNNQSKKTWFWRVFWLFWIILGLFLILVAINIYVDMQTQPAPNVDDVQGIIPKIIVMTVVLIASTSALAILLSAVLAVFAIYIFITLIIWIIRRSLRKRRGY